MCRGVCVCVCVCVCGVWGCDVFDVRSCCTHTQHTRAVLSFLSLKKKRLDDSRGFLGVT